MEESLRRSEYTRFIIEKYSDMIIRICFSYMKNISDAEDVAQEVFVKLMEKNQVFESPEHQKAWLIRVAINLCKNRLRTVWFKRILPLKEEEVAYDFTAKEIDVMDAVLSLPAKYRSIILLFYYEDYRISEIASILGEKESTIGSKLCRARKLLKSKLKEDFDSE